MKSGIASLIRIQSIFVNRHFFNHEVLWFSVRLSFLDLFQFVFFIRFEYKFFEVEYVSNTPPCLFILFILLAVQLLLVEAQKK